MKSKLNKRVGPKNGDHCGVHHPKAVKYEFTKPSLKLGRFKADDMERHDDEGIVKIPEGTENANGGAEGSTGPDAYGHQDKSEAKCAIATMKYEIQRLDCTVYSMEPNMSTLIQVFGHIESSLPKMKEDVVKDIVAEVLKALTSKGSDSLALVKEKLPNPSDEMKGKTGICDAAIKGNNFSSLAAKLHHARLAGSINTKTGSASAMENYSRMKESHPKVHIRGTFKQWYKPEPVIFPLMGKLSTRDSSILDYLFSKSGIGEERWSEEVARNGDFCVTRSELQCLSPTLRLSSKVINIAAAHVYEDNSQRWFFPTYFGERAKGYASHTHAHGWVAATINICQLQRFHRRLRQCRQASKRILLFFEVTCMVVMDIIPLQIFIPLNDDKCMHWFLLVMDLVEQRAEVWDSRPDSGSEERRLEYASVAIEVLQIIFANEMTKTRDVYFHFPSFIITVPESNPTMDNNHDSGIYVIRHMQYYRREWFREFNSEDQRIRLALEITNHPRNEMSESVLAAAAAHKQAHVDLHANISYNKVGRGINNAGRILPESQPTHETKPPTGWKCRSHRKRRSRQ